LSPDAFIASSVLMVIRFVIGLTPGRSQRVGIQLKKVGLK
jgi:hypothetical protein